VKYSGGFLEKKKMELIQEDVRVVSVFNAQIVTDTLKPFNEAVDMGLADKVSYMFGADDTYEGSDADLTLSIFEVDTNVTTGGVLLKSLTILSAGGAAVKQGVSDVKASELISGKTFLYAEILGDDATQTAEVWGVAIAGGLRYGRGNQNALTGTTFKV